MHRTHRFMGCTPGSRLVEFHKQHGIGDGRSGSRPIVGLEPSRRPEPPRGPEPPRWNPWLKIVALIGLAILFALWALFCVATYDVGTFGAGR